MKRARRIWRTVGILSFSISLLIFRADCLEQADARFPSISHENEMADKQVLSAIEALDLQRKIREEKLRKAGDGVVDLDFDSEPEIKPGKISPDIFKKYEQLISTLETQKQEKIAEPRKLSDKQKAFKARLEALYRRKGQSVQKTDDQSIGKISDDRKKALEEFFAKKNAVVPSSSTEEKSEASKISDDRKKALEALLGQSSSQTSTLPIESVSDQESGSGVIPPAPPLPGTIPPPPPPPVLDVKAQEPTTELFIPPAPPLPNSIPLPPPLPSSKPSTTASRPVTKPVSHPPAVPPFPSRPSVPATLPKPAAPSTSVAGVDLSSSEATGFKNALQQITTMSDRGIVVNNYDLVLEPHKEFIARCSQADIKSLLPSDLVTLKKRLIKDVAAPTIMFNKYKKLYQVLGIPNMLKFMDERQK